MQPLAFGLIFLSACIHASWNVVVRHLKGNTPVLVVSHVLGSLIFLPWALWDDGDLLGIFRQRGTGRLVLCLSTTAHGLYIVLLATAYIYGDVSLVYPLARGTAIVLATTISQAFGIGKPLHGMEMAGIALVLVGIVALCVDASQKKPEGTAYQAVTTIDTDADDEIAQTVEMVPATAATAVTNIESPDGDDGVQKTSESWTERHKLLISIVLAILTGTCTASYTVLDSIAVLHMPTLTYNFWMNLLSAGTLLPFMFVFYRKDTVEAFPLHGKSIAIVAPGTVGAYLIILYVFSLPDVNIALVVTLREFSVLIGAFLGVVLLGERWGAVKLVAICCILAGMVVLKLA